MNLTRLELAIRDRADALKQAVYIGKVTCTEAPNYLLRAAILIDLAECLANYEVRENASKEGYPQ